MLTIYNAEYWKNQLPFYQKSIHLAKEKIQEEVEHLLQKGVNITEIENQNKITEDKIEKLDKKLEELPSVREELVCKYRLEKEELLKINIDKDYIKERESENYSLFRKIDFNLFKQNYARKNGNSAPMNIIQEQSVFSQRKR